jgi:hypothetical protein
MKRAARCCQLSGQHLRRQREELSPLVLEVLLIAPVQAQAAAPKPHLPQ